MEIGGASDRDVDRVQWVDDLNVKTLIALIDRLKETAGSDDTSHNMLRVLRQRLELLMSRCDS